MGYLDYSDVDTQFSTWYEADATSSHQYYSFTYDYGNGDTYSGYGYALADTYTSGQVLSGYSNETGYTGSYTINYVNTLAGTSTEQNQVYVSNYYDSENDRTYYSLSNGTGYWGAFGSSGLGSEFGYLDINDSNTQFSYFNEADVLAGYQYYSFTYSYGNGDTYKGSGYAPSGTYTSNQTWNTTNETGYLGTYTINYVSDYAGTTGWLNQVYISEYYNNENDTVYTYPVNGVDYTGVFSTTGLGYEAGYLDVDNSNTYFTSYNEADITGGYQYYSFTYSYGNGDTYSGYGYAPANTYVAGDYWTTGNETGYTGWYTIDFVSDYAGTTSVLNEVYLSSYYNSENDTTYTDLSNGTSSWGAFGTSGLSSEYGYLDSSDSETYFSYYNEADVTVPQYQYYTFTYSYGSGDYYNGAGYAPANTYATGSSWNTSNETGYTGTYTIDFASNYVGTTDEMDNVYVWSYYNSENATTYDSDFLYNSSNAQYSAFGTGQLGSESGYVETYGSTMGQFSSYYEADIAVVPPSYIEVLTPNGGNSLTTNTSTTITWDDNISDNVTIELWKGGSYNRTIATSTTSDGTYDWTVPTTLTAANDYSIRIASVNNSALFDDSNNAFKIIAEPTNSFDIKFDYRFDTNGWFTSEKKAALEAAANIWESFIGDEFEETPVGTRTPFVRNPATGEYIGELEINSRGDESWVFMTDTTIDDVLIFVGARDLGNRTLGLAGPSGSSISETRYTGDDFEPWVGTVAFDVDTNWYFDSSPLMSDDIPSGQSDFVSVAVHEIGHVLGIGSSKAYKDLSSSGVFTGPEAKRRNGGNPIPLEPSPSDPSRYPHIKYGYSFGNSGEPVMDPDLTRGTRKLPTVLDLALLDDIGYEISEVAYSKAYQNT